MIRNKKMKYLTILIIIIIVIILLITKNKVNKIQVMTAKINNKNYENYNAIDNEEPIILYNELYLPMNKTFKAIIGENYKDNTNQKIKVNGVILIIDIDKLNINIPNIIEDSSEIIDNSIDVEIEDINNKYYIPAYLIGNLPQILIKVNNKEIKINDENISKKILNKEENKIDIYVLEEENKVSNSNTYFGEEEGATWRKEALKRIEKYRKKQMKFIIKNKYNNEINNTKIQINMKNNEFLFGTAIRVNQRTNESDFENINRKVFNIIGCENALKWDQLNEVGTKNVNELINFAQQENMNTRGHFLWVDYKLNSFKELVGEENTPQKGTMSYIYQKYNSGEIDINKARELIEELKRKLKEMSISHVKEEINMFPQIKEWDIINSPILNQYFKYYLFDKNLLTDNSFIRNNEKNFTGSYSDNEEYYKFIAEIIDAARYTSKANLIINLNKVDNINRNSKEAIIKYLNNIKKYTNNIDGYGVQYHVGGNYKLSPQAYFNNINDICNKTGIKNVAITEYDNLIKNYKNASKEENNIRGKYLRDTLISAYSNTKIYEFCFWVYNSKFSSISEEERQEYEKLISNWLNYSEEATTTEEGYSTRLYKGTYTATVTLPNGKTKDIEFTVSDDTSDTVEVIIDSEITNVKIKQQPSKIKYYRNDNIDLTDGVLEISYDDGTTKELAMNDSNINTVGFDSSVLGKQTIKLNYKGHEITFEIEVEESKDNLIKNSIKNIESGNIKLKNNYNYISNNIEILNSYNSIISKINELKQNIKNIDNSKINELYKSEFDLASKIIDEYNKKTINISEEDLKNVLNNITELTSNYTELYKYYFNNDTIDNEQITNNINKLIDIYNYNKDIELQLELHYINQVKDIYNNSITGQNNYENYLNKRRIQNTCTIISKMLENKIKETAQQEAQKIGIAYNIDPSTLTNKDVIAQIKLPNSKSSIESNPNNEKYTFTENGTKNITINMRGYKYNYNIKVTNIDKTPPQITGIEQDGKYKESITPQITDENLSEVKLIKDGQEVENYKQNTAITQEGIYQLKATDKAGNETSINFVIAYPEDEKYKIENNTIKNIKGETSVETLKGKLQVDEKYTIKRKDTEIQNSENIATGDILETESGNKYTLIVRGDLNKDGKVDIKDLVKMRKFLLLGNNLEESEEMAADTNLDGKEISIKDLVKMRIILLTQ